MLLGLLSAGCAGGVENAGFGGAGVGPGLDDSGPTGASLPEGSDTAAGTGGSDDDPGSSGNEADDTGDEDTSSDPGMTGVPETSADPTTGVASTTGDHTTTGGADTTTVPDTTGATTTPPPGMTTTAPGTTPGGGTSSTGQGGSSPPLLSSALDTSVFPTFLDTPYRHPGHFRIMVPSDVDAISVSFSPNNGSDELTAEFYDGGILLGTCTAPAAGAACELIDVDTTLHNGRVLTAVVADQASQENIGDLIVDIDAHTMGMQEELSATGAWRTSSGRTDYVIWPIGPANASGLAYTWSDTKYPFDDCNVGAMGPDGIAAWQLDVSQPDTADFPTGPQGWAIMATSTRDYDSASDSYTLTVTP